jgi:hypothetical protein
VLLRKVDKRRWDWSPGTIDWVPSGDIPAAPLADFNTSVDSKISVWYVESDKSNLERIIAGIAAGRQTADKFDYVLFPETVLSQAGVKAEDAQGQSKDKDANAKWHRDLVELSATKLIKLVALVGREGGVGRSSEHEVIALIRKFVEAGFIERPRLHEALRKHVFGN